MSKMILKHDESINAYRNDTHTLRLLGKGAVELTSSKGTYLGSMSASKPSGFFKIGKLTVKFGFSKDSSGVYNSCCLYW